MNPRDRFHAFVGIGVLFLLATIALVVGGLARSGAREPDSGDPEFGRGLIKALGMARFAVTPPPADDGKPRCLWLVVDHRGHATPYDTGVRTNGKKEYFFLWGLTEKSIHYSFDRGGTGIFPNPISGTLSSDVHYVWVGEWPGDASSLDLSCGREFARMRADPVLLPQSHGGIHAPTETMVFRLVIAPDGVIPDVPPVDTSLPASPVARFDSLTSDP